MKRPKVTVMMPAFNASKYIRASIESVLGQDLTDFELVIVDDGSTDDTYRIACGFKSNGRVRVYRNARKMGQSLTRNCILQLSRGKYVAPHDADDIMLQGRLRRHVKIFESNPDIGVVFGDWFISNEGLTEIKGYIRSCKTRRSGLVTEIPSSLSHCASTMATDIVQEAGGYDSKIPESADIRLFLTLFSKVKFYYSAAPCFIYRRHAASKTAINIGSRLKLLKRIFYSKRCLSPRRELSFRMAKWFFKVRGVNARFMKTLQWRLNHYLECSIQKDGQEGQRWVFQITVPRRLGEGLSDAARYHLGFLAPFQKILCRKNGTLLKGALLSKDGKGILIFAEGGARIDDIIFPLLGFHNFHYYSSGTALLYAQGGRVFGRSFIDPLVLSKRRRASRHIRGAFWNPLLKRYCVNIDLYTAYLLGETCPVDLALFVKIDRNCPEMTKRNMDSPELYSRLAGDPYGKIYLSEKGEGGLLEKLSRQARGVFIELAIRNVEKLPRFFMTLTQGINRRSAGREKAGSALSHREPLLQAAE